LDWFQDSYWYESLSPADKERAQFLAEKFAELDVVDPVSYSRGEIEFNQPTLAISMFVKSLWGGVKVWRDPKVVLAESMSPSSSDKLDRSAPLRRLLQAGASAEDLAAVCGAVALESIARVLNLIELGPDDNEISVSWQLVEGGSEAQQPRLMDNLYEAFLGERPRGF